MKERQGKIDVKGRRGRRRKQLLDYLKGKRECWKLKEGAYDCTVWRTGFGIVCVLIVRQTAKWMKTAESTCMFNL